MFYCTSLEYFSNPPLFTCNCLFKEYVCDYGCSVSLVEASEDWIATLHDLAIFISLSFFLILLRGESTYLIFKRS